MEFYLNLWCAIFIYLPLASSFSQGIFHREKRPQIDGAWSSWQGWSACYKNDRNITKTAASFYLPWENFYIQSRNRTCSSPKPLFGGKPCKPPSHRFRQCLCINPLFGKNRLKDSLLSASSILKGYESNQVRFGNDTVGWCAKSKGSFFTETFLQVNFENFTNVGAITTIGNTKGRITRYKMKYSLNGKSWKYIRDAGNNLVFRGNSFVGRRKKNNFSTHVVMKYLRVIPVRTYDLPCMKMEVYGCVFTCGSKLTVPYGALVAQSSEIYDQNCLWRVEVLNTTSLTFVFSIFYVLCEDGYLDFHSGETSFTNAPLLRRVCLRPGEVAIPNLTLNKNSLWVRFVSNSSSNEVSFNIKYLAKCSQQIELVKGKSVTIKSPNYPSNYFGNLDCSWVILPPVSLKQIDIKIDDFDVESNGSPTKCDEDFVVIDTENYGGVRKKYNSYCNNKKPPKKISLSSDKVIISFKSDPLVNSKGFKFSIISGKKDITPTNPASGVGKSGSATVGQEGVNKDSDIPNSTYQRKVKSEPKDDTWTVIIICTFSSLVVVLIATVVYLNCRRFINNRNELSAHCAKQAEENRKKEKYDKRKEELMRQKNVLLTPPRSPTKVLKPTENLSLLENGNDYEVINKPEQTNGHIKHVHSEIDIHNEMNQSTDQIDGDLSSGTSSQLSSPVKDIVVNCESLSNEDTESVI